jgi:hypothetical protein
MSKRNAGRRGRARKRRGAAVTAAPGAAVAADTSAATSPARPAAGSRATGPAGATTRSRGARRGPAERGTHRDPGGVGERPDAPWHPWPFSELLILVGAIGTIVGIVNRDPRVLYAGLAAVVIGTLEFTFREHRSGYRAHSSLLAAVPTALLHGGIALGLFLLGAHGGVLVIAPLAIDVPVFWLLFRFLRARFDDARRERVFALGRR